MKRTLALVLFAACSAETATPTDDDGMPDVAIADLSAPVGGTWAPLTHQPPVGVGVAILLRDGSVMAQELMTPNWYKLTPTRAGSYRNGSWKQIASMPSDYGPLYYASGVLPDGRVIVMGGEYNLGSQEWTNKGAIYDPKKNVWTAVAAPAGWANIGDAQSVILPNGRFMLANALTTQSAVLDPTTLTWTESDGTGKADGHDEEAWTLLWNGKLLTVDCNVQNMGSELYTYTTGAWVSGGSTKVQLSDLGSSTDSHEIGPAALRPDGTVFVAGATGHNAVYDSVARTWTAAPDFPLVGGQQLDIADGPSAVLPNGNILMAASPGVFQTGTHYFEWDGKALTEVANVPNAVNDSSYQESMLVLPTGEIMLTDQSAQVMLYTGKTADTSAWAPVVQTFPATFAHAATIVISALRANGVTQGAGYGDDGQTSTNYPIVRITNVATGHVRFAYTRGQSSSTIKPTAVVTFKADIPSTIELGASKLEVIANGVASAPVDVTID